MDSVVLPNSPLHHLQLHQRLSQATLSNASQLGNDGRHAAPESSFCREWSGTALRWHDVLWWDARLAAYAARAALLATNVADADADAATWAALIA